MMMTSLTSTSSMEASTTTKETIKIEILVSTTKSLIFSLFVFLDSLFSMNIINLSLLFITQSFISISNFLKFLFCPFWIICIFIRMVFNGHFLKLFLYFFFAGVSFETKDFVIVFTFLFWLLLLSLTTAAATKATTTTAEATTSTEMELSLNFEEGLAFVS